MMTATVAAVGLLDVNVAQHDQAPRIVGVEPQGIDERVLGLLGPLQLDEAHGEVAVHGRERRIQLQHPFVEFDGAGKIAHIWKVDKVKGHAEAVLAHLKG